MEDATFNKLMLLTMIIAVIALVIYKYYIHHLVVHNGAQCPICEKCNSCPICPACPACPACQKSKSDSEIINYRADYANRNTNSGNRNVIIDIKKESHLTDPVREYDYRALSDPLVPPYKRDDYQVPLPVYPTRGYPSSFKKIGLLVDSEAVNTDPYKFMLLMGRQKYPGANYYDYYVTENKSDSALKFDMPNLHKELNTDDTLSLSDLEKTYTVKIDRNLGFDYNPFVY